MKHLIYIHCACKHTFIWGRCYLPTINTQNIITNYLQYMRIHIYMMCYPISLSFFSVDNLYSHHWNTQFCSFFLGPIYLVLILKNNKNIPVVNELHSLVKPIYNLVWFRISFVFLFSCPYHSRRRQKKCFFNLNMILPTTHIPTTGTWKWPHKIMPGVTIMVSCKQRSKNLKRQIASTI